MNYRCAGGLDDSARSLGHLDFPTHRTPSYINLELAQRIFSSLHRAERVPF